MRSEHEKELLNNYAEEIITKMDINRNRVIELKSICSKLVERLEQKQKSKKSFIQYSVLYLSLLVLNIDLAGFLLNNSLYLIGSIAVLTGVYVGVSVKDIVSIIKNNTKKINNEFNENNLEMISLNNDYLLYERQLEEIHDELNMHELYIKDEEELPLKNEQENRLVFTETEKVKVLSLFDNKK